MYGSTSTISMSDWTFIVSLKIKRGVKQYRTSKKRKRFKKDMKANYRSRNLDDMSRILGLKTRTFTRAEVKG
jgi:hypothetical protein